MKDAIFILLGIMLFIIFSMWEGGSINSRNARWNYEVETTDDLDRLYQISDSMEYFREQVEDTLYKKCKDKISTIELYNI